MSIKRICHRNVSTASAKDTVERASQIMKEQNVGSLVIVNAAGQPEGILTDRDITVRVIAEKKDATKTKISEVMTHNPVAVSEDTPIEVTLGHMRSGSLRRILVMGEDRKLAGIVSLDDILELLIDELSQVGKVLKKKPADPQGQVS